MPFDLRIDPETRDISLVSSYVTGFELTLQKATIRLLTYLREVLRNQFVGLNYFAWMAVKPPPLGTIESAVVAELADTDGIARVLSAEATFDLEERLVRMEGSVLLREDTETATATFTLGIDNSMAVFAQFFLPGRITPLQGATL